VTKGTSTKVFQTALSDFIVSLVDGRIQFLQQWKTSDIVTKVQSYQEIKDFLQPLYRQLGNSRVRVVQFTAVRPDMYFSPLLRIPKARSESYSL
jgi:hypothetical protein